MLDSKTDVIYEQPMNELMRICLRLEHFFQRIDQCLKFEPMPSDIVMNSIFNILRVVDRSDLKSRLTTALNRYVTDFSKLLQFPVVNKVVLEDTLDSLRYLNNYFMDLTGKIGITLRNQPFIVAIYQHFTNPGDCYVNSPIYRYWLQKKSLHRGHIDDYLQHLDKISQAVRLLLKIARQSVEFQDASADQGFFSQNLDATLPWQLIRVSLGCDLGLYPEISAGRHRVIIRFMDVNFVNSAKQTEQRVHFRLSCCAV